MKCLSLRDEIIIQNAVKWHHIAASLVAAAAPRKLDYKSALLSADVVRLTMLEHVISKEDWVMVEP
jgi:hypothetical protein